MMEMTFLISSPQKLDSFDLLRVAEDDEILCWNLRSEAGQTALVISYPLHGKLDPPEILPKLDSGKFCLNKALRKLSTSSEKWY